MMINDDDDDAAADDGDDDGDKDAWSMRWMINDWW